MRNIFAAVATLSAVVLYYVFSNPPTLIQMAELSDSNQSSFYIFCLERVYSNIDCNDDTSFEYLADSQTAPTHPSWLRVLAVSGSPSAARFIQRKLEESVTSQERVYFLDDYIKSAGILGLDSAKDLLIEIAQSDNKFNYVERGFAITSLYMLDGENYGEQFGQAYIVDEKMKRVREAIVNSDGNCRSVEEMLVIDSSYRATY